MFQLNQTECKRLVTNCHRFKSLKHSSVMPYAFTEHGVAMLATVLRSERAVLISINIIKTFIKLREMFVQHAMSAKRLDELEHIVGWHDEKINIILESLRELTEADKEKKPLIGFYVEPKNQ